MTDKTSNPPLFGVLPLAFRGPDGGIIDFDRDTYSTNITLRDLFAGMGLIGLVANLPTSMAAEVCYRYADAMLAEREKKL